MDDLEERLRHDLRQRASSEEPSADAWDRITDRMQREERRSTASRALVGALVLAITAGGLFWLWRGFVATDEESPAGQAAIEGLLNRTFVSTRVIENGQPRALVEGTRIKMTLFEERGRRGLRWDVGCNGFGANAEITPDRLLLRLTDSSDVLCRQEYQEQDEWLAAFFRSDPRWELRGDTLTLTSGGTLIELEPAPSGDPEDLWGRTFVSTRVIEDGEPRPLVPDTNIELTFFEEQGGRGARWSAGCNVFGASLVITADRLILGEIGGTQKGGSPECQDQDDWLADFLGSDPSWELRGNSLTLSSAEIVIELEEELGQELWNRTFVSTRVTEDGSPRLLAAGTRIQVTFVEEAGRRRVEWEAGCNTFGASVELSDDGRLLLGEIGGTLMACDHLQEQDEWLAEFFRSDPRWALRDNGLTLIANGRTIIELEARGR